jgi:hypothetical protein
MTTSAQAAKRSAAYCMRDIELARQIYLCKPVASEHL